MQIVAGFLLGGQLENDRKIGSESKLTNYLKIVPFCIMNHN